MTDRPLRVVIADDEPIARRRLKRLLRGDTEVAIVAECSGGRAAVERITALRPDIVFLDIQMPDLDGLHVVAEVGLAEMPTVVFVTAYDEYALHAFDVHAVDYVMKPYKEARLRTALAHAKTQARLRGGAPNAALAALLTEVVGDLRVGGRQRQYHERVAVTVDGTIRVLPVADVDWFETEGNYIRVHVGREKYLIRNTANRLQEQLDPRRFARIHRRYIVNVERVTIVEPWFGGDSIVFLRDGTKLRLSRNYKKDFQARMLGDHSEGAAE